MEKIKKLKRVVVKEELVALTGKVDQAIILNQFIYWSERVRDIDKYLKEEAERVRKFSDGSMESETDRLEDLTNGWIYKTAAEMKDECMFEKSTTTMERLISSLVDNGWLDRRRNPKYKWDKTYQYRVNIYAIQRDLIRLGYSLEGYNLGIIELQNDEDTNLQNEVSENQIESSKLQNEASTLQNEVSCLQNEAAIPEITTETTKEIINKNLSIKEMAKKTNFINLSMNGRIEALDLPNELKNLIKIQIDRLIEFKINIQDIELHYHAVQDTYTLSEYTYVLNALLSNMNQAPDNFYSVLNNWLKRNREMMNKVTEKKLTNGSTPIREEIKPEWINNDATASAPEEQDEAFLKRKAKLEAKLKSKYAKKKVQ